MKCLPARPEALKLLMDGSAAFADVEEHGMKIDVKYLDRAIEWTGKRIKELEADLRKDPIYTTWRKHYGEGADLSKRDQLGHVVFNLLDYPCLHRGKPRRPGEVGKPKTDEEAFEHVDLQFVKNWTDHEKLKRCRTTDLIGTRRETDSDGFLHPFFHLHLATTYRSSSSDPNFQNKPNRDKRLAKLVRTAFIPRGPDYCLIEADFGAQEFKGAACFWKDPGMVAYASDPKFDIHKDMAAEIYLLNREQVSGATRGFAKNKFVFPTLYGSWWKSTGNDLWTFIERAHLATKDGVDLYTHLKSKGIKDKEAFLQHIKKVEEDFNKKFPTWSEEKTKWWDTYLKNGEFPLMTGFVCRGVYSYNNLMNTPIQGPSFHCLLWSVIQINRYFKEHKMRSRVIGQIHDSIAIDAHKDELQDVLDVTRRVMEFDVRRHWDWIIVPLLVEVDVSFTNWFEKAPWVETPGGDWAPKSLPA